MLAHVADMTSVDDTTLLEAMFFLWERMKIVVEPTGALGACALLSGGVQAKAKRVGVVLPGGNIDLAWAARRLLATQPAG